ncbi:MAG: GIY-YIG nuclease family protein [Selenomonadaceae bacterium]|nr:GIY-YIG nuclease family protein [Selenomonadaceae bacterium]
MEDFNNLQNDCQESVKMGTIYKYTNLINGKIYIGQTTQKLSRRMSKHRNSKSTSGIDGALKKYGEENFKIEVVEKCPVEQLGEREIYWIAFYDCKSPKGYNLTDGGDGLLNPSQETLERLSKASKGRALSESARENLSVINSGEGNPFYGKKHTAESLAKITAASRAYWAKHKGEKRPPFSEEHCKNISLAQKARWAKIKAEKALENIAE